MSEQASPPFGPHLGEVPQTGDLVIDAAVAALAETPDERLEEILASGEQLESVLRTRLSDLGG